MLDILLHQSGHIMLSDFDLAKQSGERGGKPATIAQIEPNGVSFSSRRFNFEIWGNSPELRALERVGTHY